MPQDSQAAIPARLLRLPQVLALVGLSRSPLYRDIAAGTFPAPVSIGARAVAWHEREVLEWIATRPTASNGSPMRTAEPSRTPVDAAVPTVTTAGRHARERRQR